MDHTNSQAFAARIQQNMLETLARQADSKQTLNLNGSFDFNPQQFQAEAANSNLTITKQMTPQARAQYLTLRGQGGGTINAGLVQFISPFTTPPHVVFGQGPQPTGPPIGTVPSSATRDTPFLVQPHILQFRYANGQVDGFYLGLYALTVPSQSVTSHTIYWHATGTGSRYRTRGVDESWTQAYDFNQASFLVDHQN